MNLIPLETEEKEAEFFDSLEIHGMEDKYVWLAGNCFEDEDFLHQLESRPAGFQTRKTTLYEDFYMQQMG
ncbi:unnamed protein product [Ceratitis capitata]|uniref:(Mediterranean fruit fly) hypothetical protein n=1 Tax=Ceratitis capitata TaxID=7213 RepID=A0A811UQ46_CERCA|nr:unnamed protein product [Ceratitis capitata]